MPPGVTKALLRLLTTCQRTIYLFLPTQTRLRHRLFSPLADWPTMGPNMNLRLAELLLATYSPKFTQGRENNCSKIRKFMFSPDNNIGS